MSIAPMPNKRKVLRILHPTDLGPGSKVAFLHALRIASTGRSVLTVLHVDESDGQAWSEMPGVRHTLAKWGVLRDAEDSEGLVALGMGVRKVISEGTSPVNACLEHLQDHPADLIVLSTHQEDGLMRWSRRNVAEPLARSAGEPTLFIPEGGKGFVDALTGNVRLKRILMPVVMQPDPRSALEACSELLETFQLDHVVFTLLHVGDATTEPMMELPLREGWTFERIVRDGDPVDTIVHVAEATKADLVLMSTKGHDGFLDALRGSTTERVLRAVKCPVLAVPA